MSYHDLTRSAFDSGGSVRKSFREVVGGGDFVPLFLTTLLSIR